MTKRNENNFLKFFKEIAIVVIGVLVAVSINNLKENIDNKKYIDKTLSTIQKEIIHSKKEVETVLAKHYRLADSIAAKLDNEERLSEIIFGMGGIQSPEIKNIGLRFFISNKAELVKYETISQLSDIEKAAELLEVKMKRFIDFTFMEMDNHDKKSKQKFLRHLKNVMDSEKRLLKLYSYFSQINKTNE